MTTVVLLTLLAVLDLVRLLRKRAAWSATGVLVAAVPRALLPAAAAVTQGAFQFKAAFQGIAESGSGGLGVIARSAAAFERTTLAGVIAFIAVLSVPLVLSVARKAAPVVAGGQGPRRGWSLATMTAAVVLATGCAMFAVDSADRAAVGAIAPFSRPSVLTGKTSLPPLPPAYGSYAVMSGQASAKMLDTAIRATTTGGVTLCLSLIGLSVMTSMLLSGVPLSRVGGLAAQAVTTALVLGAGWYSVQLGAAADWLRSVAGG